MNAQFLSKASTIFSIARNNEAIAYEIGFDLTPPIDSNDDENMDAGGGGANTDEAGEEPTPLSPHVGLASHGETRISFQANRTEKRKVKSVRRKKGEHPTKLSHLTNTAVTRAEYDCWMASAKAIDGSHMIKCPPWLSKTNYSDSDNQ